MAQKKISPWQHDGQSMDSNTRPYANAGITDFLQGGLGSRKKVLRAPKGFGKTMLLRHLAHTHRTQYAEEGVFYFPSGNDDIEYLQFYLDTDELWSHVTPIQSVEAWRSIWQTAILAAACRTIQKSTNIQFDDHELEKLFPIEAKNQIRVGDYVSNILRFPDSRGHVVSTGLQRLVNVFNSANVDLVMFLDNADEALSETFLSSREPRETKGGGEENFDKGDEHVIYNMGQDVPSIWVNLQIGLLLAIRGFERRAKRLHVFTSLRSEALRTIKHETQAQAHDLCTDLEYTAEDLEEIFNWNITLEPHENLVDPTAASPVERFIGQKHLPHRYVLAPGGSSHVNESLFQYLLRHSLFSPRDLMILGKKISMISKEIRKDPHRRVEAIREAVNSETTNTIFANWKVSAIPRWSSHYDEAMREISTNILSADDIANMDRLVAKAAAKDAKKPMPMSTYFYQHGLLGYGKTFDPTHDWLFDQTFVHAWRQRFGAEFASIPASQYYFLHPVLNDILSSRARIQFTPRSDHIVGYRQMFRTKPPVFVIRNEEYFGPILIHGGQELLGPNRKATQPKVVLLMIVFAVAHFKKNVFSYTDFKKHVHDKLIQKFPTLVDVTTNFEEPGRRTKVNSEIAQELTKDSMPQLVEIHSREESPVSINVKFCDPSDIHVEVDAML